MALASIILDVIERTPGPPPTTLYSWISKAKATGMNKHIGWLVAFLLWRGIR
jgi:hypothetical protein